MEEINIEKTDSEISMEFLEEYKKLCFKYKRDFYTEGIKPQIIKVEFNNDISGTLPNS